MAFFGRISWAGAGAESTPCMFDIPNEPSQHYGDNKVCLLRLFYVCSIVLFGFVFCLTDQTLRLRGQLCKNQERGVK